MFMKVFSFYIKRRKKCVNNDFKGDYFIKKQEKIYVIEDEEGVFLYRIRRIYKISVRLCCRRACCPKTLKLKPIHKVR